jgi:hypothetical protein
MTTNNIKHKRKHWRALIDMLGIHPGSETAEYLYRLPARALILLHMLIADKVMTEVDNALEEVNPTE